MRAGAIAESSFEKSFWEIFKNLLTKGKRCDIIDKLSAEERFTRIELKDSDRSLKIEQQEMKYKEQEIV